MKRIGLLLAFVVVGCAGADRAAIAPASPGYANGSAAESAPPAAYGVAAAPPPSSPKAEAASVSSTTSTTPTPIAVEAPVRVLPKAGQLTAGVWDDNVNFEFYRPYATKFADHGGQDFQMFSVQEMETARTTALAQGTAKTDLDVQLVLDTTGSMGDELQYLQSEFDSIATQVKTKFPNVTPHWSLVLYRDHGDEYVTRDFGFTTDTNRFRENLKAQSAGGGGDTPEAVVEGLTKGLAQNWRSGSVAKLVFWVADAPAHPGEGGKLATAIRDARSKGIHIYPVASSDADESAEYQMRAAAQMTGGRYVFLTNDSGIGNSHAEPHIPCYAVTKLDQAIVRMIAVEMAGKRVEPDDKQVLRQVGQPDKAGKCKLASGMLVASY